MYTVVLFFGKIKYVSFARAKRMEILSGCWVEVLLILRDWMGYNVRFGLLGNLWFMQLLVSLDWMGSNVRFGLLSNLWVM